MEFTVTGEAGTMHYRHYSVKVSFDEPEATNIDKHPYTDMNQKDQEFHRSVGRTIAIGRDIAYRNMQNAARISELNNMLNRGSQEVAMKTAPAPVRRYADVFIR